MQIQVQVLILRLESHPYNNDLVLISQLPDCGKRYNYVQIDGGFKNTVV